MGCRVVIGMVVGSLTSQTFFVGGACGKGKRTSGNSCQLSQFSSGKTISELSCAALSYRPS